MYGLPYGVNINPAGESDGCILYVNGDKDMPVYVSEVLVHVNALGTEEGDLYGIEEFVSDFNSGVYVLPEEV